jgi:protein arginine N-methyltransferase 1
MTAYELLTYDLKNREIFDDLYQHDKMLADKVRLDSYACAIRKYVKEGDTVVDLGTGSGILAFFASARKPRKIFAIDHSDFIKSAKLVSEWNGITNIEFVQTNSRKFSLGEKVDVIIHEQIGEFLFDENIVPNLVDLRDRLLRKDGKILPSRFEMFIEPVKLKDDYREPFIWEQKIENINFGFLRSLYKESLRRTYYYHRLLKPEQVDFFLCDPEKVLSLDLEAMGEKELPSAIHYIKRVNRDGRLDGFCLYFRIIFDEEIYFDDSPLSKKTAWSIPLLRAEAKQYKLGDSIEFNLTMEDIRVPRTWVWDYR